MTFSTAFLEVIDLRSFSSIWYWIILAFLWSRAGSAVMGVPVDLIYRARRAGGEALAELETLAQIQVNRAAELVHSQGLALVALGAFMHTVLLVLALWYRVELAMAVELLLIPLNLVFFLGLLTASKVMEEEARGERLVALLLRLRFWVQVIGFLSIFITATFGMYRAFAVMPF